MLNREVTCQFAPGDNSGQCQGATGYSVATLGFDPAGCHDYPVTDFDRYGVSFSGRVFEIDF